MKKILLLLLILTACSSKNNRQENSIYTTDNQGINIEVTHATAFDLNYRDGYKIATISRPWQGSSDTIVYVLKKKNTETNHQIEKLGQVFTIPLKKIVSNSSSQIVVLEKLGLLDRLKGYAQTEYIYSDKINQLVDQGEIEEVGIEAKMNIEHILGIDPDAVVAFNMGREDRQLNKLKELGIPIILNADYMENTPLGRAEWIKFVAAFFDKETEANEYFNSVVHNYDSLLTLVHGVKKTATFSGVLYGGTWYLPGGNNFGARLMEDAGGEYVWSSDNSSGWLNISFEVVYETAHDADAWIGVASFEKLNQMKEADERYADFKAFKTKNVFSYIKRAHENGANDYFESAVIRPDVVLSDHIKMLHPELVPNYELYYFEKLK